MDGQPVLQAAGLSAGYGGAPVVRDLSLSLRPGEITVLLGPNGAGKTTTLLTLAGGLTLMGGTISWCGDQGRRKLWGRARDGLAYIADEHAVIRTLTVRDNLRVAMRDPAPALAVFPELADHERRMAGLLSGGQQKMLSLAMALGKSPRVLLADELSLGLAPLIVKRLLEEVRAAADRGVAVLLVEQHARQALSIADQALVLSRGRQVAAGTAEAMTRDLERVSSAYLGGAPADAGAGETTATGQPAPESGGSTAGGLPGEITSTIA